MFTLTHEKLFMQQLSRCLWCKNNPLLMEYHDKEWGTPVFDDTKLFEFIVLEGAQAGLNWLTILQRREYYRQYLDQFDAQKIARYSKEKLASLLMNPHLIRNRLKMESLVKNARGFLAIQEKIGSFSQYMWQFVDGQPMNHQLGVDAPYPTRSQESDNMAKELKKWGFAFVGTTICYAFMQAVGMVNDHTVNCFRH